MYTLYFMPGACSLATQVILRELNQSVTLINKDTLENFTDINPVGTVPVLTDDTQTITEGAAILLHLLDKHSNTLMPAQGDARTKAIQQLLFANATMHPAYGRLFFIAQNLEEPAAKQSAFDQAADSINQLWKVVEEQLTNQPYLGGGDASAADILLAVYARWGKYFPVTINIGPNTAQMLERIWQRPTFLAALAAEEAQVAA